MTQHLGCEINLYAVQMPAHFADRKPNASFTLLQVQG
jgi:hypothetical protein